MLHRSMTKHDTDLKIDYLYRQTRKREKSINGFLGIAKFFGVIAMVFIGITMSLALFIAPDAPVIAIRLVAGYSFILTGVIGLRYLRS